MAIDRVLVVDDAPIITRSIADRLRGRRVAVSTAGTLAEAEKLLARDSFDLLFLDVELPDGDGRTLIETLSQRERRPIIVMITANDSMDAVVSCMRAGAFDYLAKPFSMSQIDIVMKKAGEFSHAAKVADYLNREAVGARELLGESASMRQLRELIQRVARTDATVMISGESGTGKELVASELFLKSRRNNRPFIKVNCAAISEKLIESEFFGHERGAFTGATEQRDGRFELAHGGTILLDEVSEIPAGLQAKLLRVLQEKEFERVGGNRTIKVDVRVIATTNRDLPKAVENGDFREDLYYRLNVFPIHVPPLREREGDVELLARCFLNRFSRQNGGRNSGFTAESLAALREHHWPGNVRELQNVVERAAILAEENEPIEPGLLGSLKPGRAGRGPASGEAAAAIVPRGEVLPLAEVERRCIFHALERTGGNRTHAAQLLDISIRTLRNKLAEYRSGPVAA